MSKRIYLSPPHMSGEEMKYIQEAFDTNWIAPLGANVDGFEKDIAEYIGISYATALTTCTAAIHLALKYLGVGHGDIVFCSSFTFAGTCNPITYLGATPVFIDCDENTWNLSPAALKKAYEKYPNPKAIIVVNLYGQCADFDEIREITSKNNTPIIEDAAESLGATYKGKQSGTLGDIAVFSFNGNKIITTSGGGMLVSEDKAVIEKVKFWATQARDPAPHYEHTEIGNNYRLSNVLAGIGRGQMTMLDQKIAKKHHIYNYYKKAFEGIKDIELMPLADFGKSNCWLTAITLKEGSAVKPLDIIHALEKDKIESRPLWKPMHLQPVFSHCDFFATYDTKVVCEDLFKRGLCLPSDTQMTDEDLDRVISTVKGLFA